MRKIIGAINMTIDGNCDHTEGIPDEQIHDHYTELLDTGDVILYGRKTYDLMGFWKTIIEKPTGEKSMDDFAVAIDRIPKIVFSETLESTNWESAELSSQTLEEKVAELKQQSGNSVLVGSRSLIIQLINLGLLDELQLCIYPVIAGKGLQLFENVSDRTLLKLVKTKTFDSGAIILYYNK